MIRTLTLAFTLLLANLPLGSSAMAAQGLENYYPNPPSAYSGFRVGMLHISGDIIPHMKSHYELQTPTLTQVGWQFDKKLRNLQPGLGLHLETSTMLSGFEQSIALPSIGSMVNWRWSQGVELGTGLILAPYGGLSLAANAGGIFRWGKKPVPINLIAAINSQAIAFSLHFNLFSSATELPLK